MTAEQLRSQIAALAQQITGKPLDSRLADWLNTEHGPLSDSFRQLQATCEAGVHDGWLCNREGGGIRYGRIFKPADDLQGFSVDVVDMALAICAPEARTRFRMVCAKWRCLNPCQSSRDLLRNSVQEQANYVIGKPAA